MINIKEFNQLAILLNEKLKIFDDINTKTVNGKKANPGIISLEEAKGIYNLIQDYKPHKILETGVCNGYSTAFILLALEQNEQGHLYSIDYPEVIGLDYEKNNFWNGKGGAAIPKGTKSGWIIPSHLKKRWSITYGKSIDILENLLEEIGEIDVFIHDSEHSYECMSFEFNIAYEKLKKNGLLIADDIHWNSSFFDFAKKRKKKVEYLAKHMGMIIK